MKFFIVKTTVVTTKKLYGVEIAGYLDPLDYMDTNNPISNKTDCEVKTEIFREEEANSE